MDLTSFQTYLSINVSQKTTMNYVNQMAGFFRCHSEFTQEEVNKYLASKVDRWSDGSYNAFFKAVIWYVKFTKIPIELPEFKKVERKPRTYLKEKDIEDILIKIPLIFGDGQKIQIIFELLFMSGLRPEELLTLKRNNINIEESKIVLVETKTRFSRTVFIPKELAIRISNYFNSEPEKENAFNLNNQSLGYYCRTISKHLNINIYPYMTRHSFAHAYYRRSGNDIVALAKLLGHTNLSSTQVYSDIDEKELKEKYNRAFKNKRRKK